MRAVRNNIFVLVLLISLTAVSNSQSELPAYKIYDMVNNSVVVILCYDNKDNMYQGSGVVLNSNGYIATNFHVCKDGDRIEISHYNKLIKTVEVAAVDTDKDILILKIPPNLLPSIAHGYSDSVRPGQRVYAIGSPEGYENSISEGIISGFRYDENDIGLIQMTTPITEGSSGGALVNAEGELIGLCMSGQHEGNLYFAIPSNDVYDMLDTSTAPVIAENETKDTTNYFEEGSNASKKKDYEDAVFYFSKYLEKNINDGEAYFNRGYAHLKLKEFQLAVTDLTNAVSYNKENFVTYFYRGNAYYSLKDYVNAVTDYTKAIKLAPGYAETFYNRGYANYKLRKNAEAIKDWKKAIELNPEYESELGSKIKEALENDQNNDSLINKP
ncbi:MAG: trypsin-like peptidase domain-containing protein [Ignavibacteria bacterium]